MKIELSQDIGDNPLLKGLIGMVEETTSIKAVARRLKTLRGALGKNQVEMTTIVGGVPGANSLWAQYEGGQRWIHPTKAVRLCAAFGVTLEWIYRGQEHTLPGNIRDLIRYYEKSISGSGVSRHKRPPLLA